MFASKLLLKKRMYLVTYLLLLTVGLTVQPAIGAEDGTGQPNAEAAGSNGQGTNKPNKGEKEDKNGEGVDDFFKYFGLGFAITSDYIDDGRVIKAETTASGDGMKKVVVKERQKQRGKLLPEIHYFLYEFALDARFSETSEKQLIGIGPFFTLATDLTGYGGGLMLGMRDQTNAEFSFNIGYGSFTDLAVTTLKKNIKDGDLVPEDAEIFETRDIQSDLLMISFFWKI